PIGYKGTTSTYAYIARFYFWPGITYNINYYVGAYIIYKRIKHVRTGKYRLFKPLPILDQY
ncbi:uncharacterized protein BDZ99DRAFT_397803, partial [Mytilinidion resinicola]